MILVFATPEEARELLGLSTRQPESGPCMHYGLYGCEVPRDDGQCPHLDNPKILCPVKDACYAMHEVARTRDECEQEQEVAGGRRRSRCRECERQPPEGV